MGDFLKEDIPANDKFEKFRAKVQQEIEKRKSGYPFQVAPDLDKMYGKSEKRKLKSVDELADELIDLL